jgi:hypothetical protein
VRFAWLSFSGTLAQLQDVDVESELAEQKRENHPSNDLLLDCFTID